mgnify:CR=1 FL=1
MKKVVITLLLILPFLLIYFISFTGQILSKYTYIPVERIVLLDENGDELENNTVTCKQGEKYQMRIKVLPEFASNKQISIANTNWDICPIDENYVVTAKELGEVAIIITSNDKHNVQYVFRFKVAQEELEDIAITLDGHDLENNQSINLGLNKSKNLGIRIIPSSTALAYREIVWSTSNSEFVKINQNGQITGLKQTSTPITITATSLHNPSIKKSISVNVVSELEKGVWFVASGLQAGRLYSVPLGDFDLKSITKIVDLPADIAITYKITIGKDSTGIDASRLSEGIIKFKAKNTAIEVKLIATNGSYTYYDTIRMISK